MKFVVGKKYYFVMNPMKYFEDSSYLVMFRSVNDCSGDWSERSGLFTGVSSEKSRCCRKVNYSNRSWNEQLKWQLCTRYCNQALGVIAGGRECANSRCEIAG